MTDMITTAAITTDTIGIEIKHVWRGGTLPRRQNFFFRRTPRLLPRVRRVS
jgi:hypothetical protein